MTDLLRLTRAEWAKLWRHRLTWGLLLVLVAVLILQTRGLFVEVRDEPSVAAKVDEYMRAQMAAWPKWDMSAAVLVTQAGEVLVNKGYGLARRETGTPITPDTIFPLASISKQFTALAIVQLEEAGLLSVEDRLAQYYPSWPRSDEITLHHLLTHSSGLPNGTTLSVPDALAFEPGTEARYSNLNYLLLGEIVEQVSGQSLGDYLQAHVFGPLGMQNSGFDPATVSGQLNAALGYARGRDGPKPVPYPSLAHAGGAGALYSTAADLYRWDRALYTETLVSQEMLDRIFSPYYPYQEYSVGYGWMVGTLKDRTVAMHGGILDGATGIIARFPEQDAAIIVLSNTDWAPVTRIAEDLAAILFGENYVLPVQHTAEIVLVDPAVYDAYVGVYDVAEQGLELEVRRERDRLLLDLRTAADMTTMELYPLSETRFVADMGDTELAFVSDEAGVVNQIQVTSGGREVPPAIRRGAGAPVERDLSNLNRMLATMEMQASFGDRLEAVTLPAQFERLPRVYDWLIVSIILLGVVSVSQEFSWGTMRAALARGAPRVRLLVAKLLALAALSACYLAVLWLVCAALGLWTTRTLQGSIDWGFLDGAFWLAQLGILGRTWLIALSASASTIGVYVWVGRAGPAFSLRFLGYFLSLIAYFFLTMLPMLVLTRPDVDPSAFGDTLWARVVELEPHRNSRIVASWGQPSVLYNLDYSVWIGSQIFGLNHDPLYATLLLVLYGFVPFALGALSFSRREMRP